jgi:serine/threonine protein kinase
MDTNSQVKLCDFGLAIDQKFEQANTRLGTFGYFAPGVRPEPRQRPAPSASARL